MSRVIVDFDGHKLCPVPFAFVAVTSSCLALRNRDDLFTCAEKCKLHSGGDNFHEQTAQTQARGELCRAGLQACNQCIPYSRILQVVAVRQQPDKYRAISTRSFEHHIETLSARTSCTPLSSPASPAVETYVYVIPRITHRIA